MTLGISSLTSFGVVGVAIEVVLIAFLFVCSLVGLYTIPGIRCIRPTAHETTLTQIILNCGLYVILSSALPLLAKILGKSNAQLSWGIHLRDGVVSHDYQLFLISYQFQVLLTLICWDRSAR